MQKNPVVLERMHVTVLSNGILLKGTRLQQLEQLPHSERLTVQISLDGSDAATHEFYRGVGNWQKAIDAIVRLKDAGFHVRLDMRMFFFLAVSSSVFKDTGKCLNVACIP